MNLKQFLPGDQQPKITSILYIDLRLDGILFYRGDEMDCYCLFYLLTEDVEAECIFDGDTLGRMKDTILHHGKPFERIEIYSQSGEQLKAWGVF